MDELLQCPAPQLLTLYQRRTAAQPVNYAAVLHMSHGWSRRMPTGQLRHRASAGSLGAQRPYVAHSPR